MSKYIIILLFINTTCFAASPRDYIDYYVNWYGIDYKAATAHRVFERLKQVANKNPKFVNPKLRVLNNRGRNPWARALRDGNIVLWRSAIDASYSTSKDEFEARLAFILGHELGHLANDDYWHLKLDYKFYRRNRLFTRARMKKELAADAEGYAYAALAGYKVKLLKKSFLTNWLQKVKAPKNSGYPPIQKRLAILETYLDQIKNKYSLFEYGVRLSHFKRCDDAEYFFREFLHVFPAREVLNNLGFCYLQQARQKMNREHAYFYWMPAMLDIQSLATSIVRAGGKRYLKDYVATRSKPYLEEAIIYLKKAAASDKKYIPARINLVITYLYLGKPYKARSIIEELRRLAPNNIEIKGLLALTIYEQSEIDMDLWSLAVSKLERLITKANAPAMITYNLARLLQIRPRPAQAEYYWNHLIDMQLKTKTKQSLRWKSPIAFNWQRISQQRKLVKRLYSWGRPTYFNWQKAKLKGKIYQRPDGKLEILELDDFIQMQVLKGKNLPKTHKLPKYCKQTLQQRRLINGILWSCNDWAALSFDGKVQEVWRVLK